MKKTDLKDGMIIQTTHNRFGVVEMNNHRVDICYDPDSLDNDKVLEKVSMDNIFEFGKGQLGIGYILNKEMKEKYPSIHGRYSVGDTIIGYEIVSVYELKQIYSNGEGIYPSIKLE